MQTIIIDYKDTMMLYKSYMPFITQGGLYTCTDQSYAIGDRPEVQVTLPEQKQAIQFTGQIIWIKQLPGKTAMIGIGIALPDNDPTDLKNKIKTLIADYQSVEPPTDVL